MKKFYKNLLCAVLSFSLIILGSLPLLISNNKSIIVNNEVDDKIHIIIDAGHGGLTNTID